MNANEKQNNAEHEIDPAIVARALAGSRSALEELLFLRFEWLRAVIYSAIPAERLTQVSVDDILQDAMVRILRSFQDFEPQHGESSLFAWLKKIAHNVAVDHLRKQNRAKDAAVGGQPSSPDADNELDDIISSLTRSTDVTASVVAREHELHNAFRIALASLEPMQRSVVELHYLRQLPLDKVAQHLEITEGSARGHRQRARERIRDTLISLTNFI